MRPELLEEVRRLPASERAQLIDTLWETLAPEDLPVTPEERALLDARMTDMEANPLDQSPWHEVKARNRQERGEYRPRVPGSPAESKFKQLKASWERDTAFVSSGSELITNIWYQQIIGLGPAALPLLLDELRSRPNHWFWALRAITGEDPVPTEDRGNIDRMAKAWLDWGHEQGLV